MGGEGDGVEREVNTLTAAETIAIVAPVRGGRGGRMGRGREEGRGVMRWERGREREFKHETFGPLSNAFLTTSHSQHN